MITPSIGLIVTGSNAVRDVQLFMKTLDLWHPNATLFIYTDTATEPALKAIPTKATVHTKAAMDTYQGKTRQHMEKLPGKHYDSLFKDYTYEKANVLDWMFETQDSQTPDGAWFMDADISHLAPLPTIPKGTQLALSPHYIKPTDEEKFGKYNAGYMWFKDKSLLQQWRQLGHQSRFYEQAALDELANYVHPLQLHVFPIQVNFGWWRMFQSAEPAHTIQQTFSLFRKDQSIGLRYDNKPLQSIHTHWFDQSSFESQMFRLWFDNWTKKFQSHKPIQQYRQWVGL
jgi:hypothetical protein